MKGGLLGTIGRRRGNKSMRLERSKNSVGCTNSTLSDIQIHALYI
jgi:hypothetical protein